MSVIFCGTLFLAFAMLTSLVSCYCYFHLLQVGWWYLTERGFMLSFHALVKASSPQGYQSTFNHALSFSPSFSYSNLGQYQLNLRKGHCPDEPKFCKIPHSQFAHGHILKQNKTRITHSWTFPQTQMWESSWKTKKPIEETKTHWTGGHQEKINLASAFVTERER